jgi:phosphatidylserine/phosphatidylglycerophosphate/cardiolipin synthase-like enzyme
MRQTGSSLQQQAYTGVVALLLFAFGAGFLVGHHGGLPDFGGTPAGGSDGDLACWFSPRGGCTEAVVAEISRASKSIQVLSYTFTSRPIGDALIDARHRGVQVTVIADKSEQRDSHSEIATLQRAGIPVYIDAKHAIAHNKVMVIDGATVITGSFNFTHAAEFENADNVLVIHHHPAIAAAYADNFQHHLSHSDPYAGG